MPAYNSDVIRTELLPLMDSRDFVWISIKDYGLSCQLREGDLIYEGLTLGLAQISDKAIFHKILYFSEFISLFVKVLSPKNP